MKRILVLLAVFLPALISFSADGTNAVWSADASVTQEVCRVRLTGFSLNLPLAGAPRAFCSLAWLDSSGSVVRTKVAAYPLSTFSDALASNGVGFAEFRAAVLRVAFPVSVP